MFCSHLFPFKSMSPTDEIDSVSVWAAYTIYKAVCVTVHFLTFPKGSIQRVMHCFRPDFTWAEWMNSFSHVLWGLFTSTRANKATLALSPNLLTLTSWDHWGFRAKNRPENVPSEGCGGGWKKNTRVRYRNECQFDLVTSGNVIPISKEVALWSCEEEEIPYSFAVITFTCALAELFMKEFSGGCVMGKSLFTNNAKSKKAIPWTKKSVTFSSDRVKNGEPRYKEREKWKQCLDRLQGNCCVCLKG